MLCFTPRVAQEDYYKRNALLWAILEKNDAMVTALLEHKANPEIQNVGTAARSTVDICWGGGEGGVNGCACEYHCMRAGR